MTAHPATDTSVASWNARVDDALDDAAEALGAAAPRTRALAPFVEALVEALAAHDPAAREQQARHEQELAAVRARPEPLLAGLDGVRAAVDRLSRLTTPTAVLRAAAVELSEIAELRRVLLSSVSDGMLTVEEAAFRDDPAGAAATLATLHAAPLRLAHRLVETDVVRRRRPELVDDATSDPRVDRALVSVMEWNGYVTAPIVVGGTVIGLLHADRGPHRQADDVDRSVTWSFATELARTYESAALRRSLRQEREQTTQLLTWLDTRSRGLIAAEVTLDPPSPAARPPRGTVPVGGASAGAGDIVVFDGLLTRRELEALRLLSDGCTNHAISEELVVSLGTVKSHVNRILAKLHVSNRAEAAARYYALVVAAPRA